MKKREYVERTLCDVCGEEANGTYFATSHLNGEVFKEYGCPLDLCNLHMSLWAREIEETAVERYGKKLTEEERKSLVNKLKAAEWDWTWA